jgi:hypothetical protein
MQTRRTGGVGVCLVNSNSICQKPHKRLLPNTSSVFVPPMVFGRSRRYLFSASTILFNPRATSEGCGGQEYAPNTSNHYRKGLRWPISGQTCA